MTKPQTLKDMLHDGHISLNDVRKIAKDIFDGSTTGAGPEGYVITAADFDTLPERLQGYLVKCILEFGVENVIDAVDRVTNEVIEEAAEQAVDDFYNEV